MAGVVIPIQSTDAGKEQVRNQLDNLGSQMSQLVQSYNDLRGKLEGENKADLREKMRQLMDQRAAAIRALIEQFKSAAASAAQQNIPAPGIPALAGLRGDDLGGLQTAVATEQSKLAALAKYYEDAKAAVAAGGAVPDPPAELQAGFMGMSSSTLAVVLALAVGAYFLFSSKN